MVVIANALGRGEKLPGHRPTSPSPPDRPGRSLNPPTLFATLAPADPSQHCWLRSRAVGKLCSHGGSPEEVARGFVTGLESGGGPFLGCFYSMSGFRVEVEREGTRPFGQDRSQDLFGCFALYLVARGSHPGRPGSWLRRRRGRFTSHHRGSPEGPPQGDGL